MSSSTDFVSKCLTTAEDTQTSLASYIVSFTSIGDYALAFLMNLTGNILSFYTTFQQIITASSTCDYTTISNRMGVLFRRLYNVTPIQTAGIKPIDWTQFKFYQEANEIFLGFRESLIRFERLSRIAREEDKKFDRMIETKNDEIFVKFYRPLQKHKVDI